jgi:hypothetical protein
MPIIDIGVGLQFRTSPIKKSDPEECSREARYGIKYVRGLPRSLRAQEISLLDAMLRANQHALPLVERLADPQVQDMNDGGMGSLRTVGSDFSALSR